MAGIHRWTARKPPSTSSNLGLHRTSKKEGTMHYLTRRGHWPTVLLVLVIGMGMMIGTSSGARDAPFWTESRPSQIPVVQAPNFADLAEQVKPAVVNISTTQVVKGQRRMSPRMPFPNPFG